VDSGVSGLRAHWGGSAIQDTSRGVNGTFRRKRIGRRRCWDSVVVCRVLCIVVEQNEASFDIGRLNFVNSDETVNFLWLLGQREYRLMILR